ncbi:MAG: hypothetical protein JNL68_18110, partial [Burkholderiales bacterium]|nr:hypothetical protein [Burkholderiales bacterium]
MNCSRLTSWIGAGVGTLLVLGCATPHHAAKTDAATSAAALTVKEVDAAQQAWCDGLLSIAKAHAEGRDYKPIAAA